MRVAGLLIAVVLTACVAPVPQDVSELIEEVRTLEGAVFDEPVRAFEGVLSSQDEYGDILHDAATGDRICVSAPRRVFERVAQIQRSSETVFFAGVPPTVVKLRGLASNPGQYGHLGICRVWLVATEVIEARPVSRAQLLQYGVPAAPPPPELAPQAERKLN